MSSLLESARPSALSRGQWRALLVVGLVLAEIAVGAMSVNFTAPGTRISAYWPNAGISVIVLCLAAPRWRPALLPALYAVAVLANLLGDRPLDLALTLGVVNVLEPLAALWVLTQGNEDPPPLRSLADLPRLLVAALAGAVVAALIVGPAIAQLVDGDLDETMRAVLASHAAALLVLVPFAMRMVPLRRRCTRTEVVVQWTGLVVVTLLVFAPGQELPLAFLPFPFLAWGALRLPTREVTVQLLVYGALTAGLTTAGHGPIVDLTSAAGQMPQVVGTLLQANLVAATLIVLPLSLVRTQQVVTLDRLTSQHDMVSNILASTTGNAILGATLDATIEFFNVGAETISGQRAQDVVGRAHLSFAPDGGDRIRVCIVQGPPPTPNPLAELVGAMLEGRSSFSADWDFIREGGEARTVSVVVTHRLGDDGCPVGFLGVGVDVTEQRQQEAAMAAALEHEKQVLERLAQVDQTKNDFLATVSHELRTPITSILGYSQLLLSDDTGTLPAMHHQIVGRIERNGKRLMGLIEDMLTMSQVEVGNLRFHRVPLDLREPVMRALEGLQPALAHRNLVLDHDLGPDAVKVLGDTDKLERVFANLVSNAIKFSHEGETIVVRLDTDGDEAVFRVTDTGLGISLEDQAHLFDRFFRSADAHALAIQGVGLGLPIAASIVAGHDGGIDVESTLGSGSTFAVRLRLLDEDRSA